MELTVSEMHSSTSFTLEGNSFIQYLRKLLNMDHTIFLSCP
jgi:hypothetical protein